MGRTISYRANGCLYEDEKKAIEDLQVSMNNGRDWRAEGINLRFEKPETVYPDGQPVAWGFTKTYESDEDTAKVLEFILRCSLIAPYTVWHVNDEGQYIPIPVTIKGGEIKPDLPEINRWNEHLLKKYMELGPEWEGYFEGYLSMILEELKFFKKNGYLRLGLKKSGYLGDEYIRKGAIK